MLDVGKIASFYSVTQNGDSHMATRPVFHSPSLEASLAAFTAPKTPKVPAYKPMSQDEYRAMRAEMAAKIAAAQKIVCQLRDEYGKFTGVSNVAVFGGRYAGDDLEADLASVALKMAAE